MDRINSTLSNAEAALLGLLSEGPMHPYRIEQEVKHRDMRFWTDLSMSSIYKLLRKMEKAGLVERQNVVSPENRLQKHYSLSQAGKTALQNKLEELLSSAGHTRWPVDIGIYNSSLLPRKRLLAALDRYRRDLEEKIQGYQDLEAYLVEHNCPMEKQEVARRPRFLLQAELEWATSFKERINADNHN